MRRIETDRQTREPGRIWLRLALEAIAIAVLATAWLAVYGQADAGAGYFGVTPVTLAKDGIPVQVGGQRVYRLGEAAKWRQLSGSFLLAGWVEQPYRGRFPGRPEAASGVGGWATLAPRPSDPANPAGAAGYSLDVLGGGGPWTGNLVVVRTRNTNPGATECTPYPCGFQFIDDVVWPVVPGQVGDQHVYRAADSAQYDKLSGSFLLGGVVATDWSCGAPLGCLAVDGRPVYPPQGVDGTPDPAVGQVAVVRIHLSATSGVCNQPTGAACQHGPFPTLDEVVGSYDPYSAPYAIPAPPVPISPIIGPTAPDGVPTTVDGEPVYRRSNLPAASAFLLGGRLARDPACPTASPSDASICGWTVDGVAIRVLVPIPESLDGQIVVVRVVRTQAAATCSLSASPCPGQEVLVMTDMVLGAPSDGAAHVAPATLGEATYPFGAARAS